MRRSYTSLFLIGQTFRKRTRSGLHNCMIDFPAVGFPMRHAEQLDSTRGCRRGLFESRSEARCVRLARSSSAAALSRQAAQGHPVYTGRDFWGGFLSVTFLGRARKVSSCRAAPGHSFGALSCALQRLRNLVRVLRLQLQLAHHPAEFHERSGFDLFHHVAARYF